MQYGEEIPAELLKSSCQPSHVFHLAEKPLHDIAHGIEVRVVRDWGFGVGFRRDDGQRAFVGDLLADGFAAVGFVGHIRQRGVQIRLKQRRMAWLSCTCPPVIRARINWPFSFTTAWTLLLRPPRERPPLGD